MIYLDNAATTLRKPPCVGEAILKALGTLGNSSRGTHEEALDAARIIYGTRVKIAALFGCERPDRVVFTSNITEALNTALFGLLGPGDHALSTVCEHNSVLRPLYRLQDERGVAVDYLPADRQGRMDLDALEDMVRPETKLIVCAHASNLTGNLVDLRHVSEIAHRHGALLVADTAQTAGARNVDMEELGIDVLCFTGHKGLLGPQGTGGMCIREGVEIRPLKVGGTGVQTYSRTQPSELPTRLESGTLNGHGIAGLSAAVDWINETGPDNIHARETELTHRFRELVLAIPGVEVYGSLAEDAAAIVSLNLAGRDSGEVSDILAQDYGIATRPGAHCAPRLHEALGTKDRGAVRFSFSWFTTFEELDAAAEALREISAL